MIKSLKSQHLKAQTIAKKKVDSMSFSVRCPHWPDLLKEKIKKLSLFERGRLVELHDQGLTVAEVGRRKTSHFILLKRSWGLWNKSQVVLMLEDPVVCPSTHWMVLSSNEAAHWCQLQSHNHEKASAREGLGAMFPSTFLETLASSWFHFHFRGFCFKI